MGNYKSRPVSTLQETWRAAATSSCDQVFRWAAGNVHDPDCRASPLHVSCAGESPESVAALVVATGATDLNAADADGFTPLHVACALGRADVIDALLAQGADPSAKAVLDTTPLHLAIWGGHKDAAVALLRVDLDSRVVNARDATGATPLHWACVRGNDALVGLLCAHGADVNAATVMCETALQLASAGCFPRSVMALFQTTGDLFQVEAVDKDRNTAVHHCAAHGNFQSLQFLLEGHLAAPDSPNVYGDTPLHLACYNGRSEVAKYLLQHLQLERLLRVENIYGETPLHAACTNGANLHLVALLLDMQPGLVNHQGSTETRHTPLHSACLNGHTTVVQLLLARGADPHLRTGDEEQATAMNWAYERGFDAVVDILQRHHDEPTALLTNFAGGVELLAENSLKLAPAEKLPLPSPVGTIRDWTQAKADVLQLCNLLPRDSQISLADVVMLECVAAGSFGKVWRSQFKGRTVAVKRYKAEYFRVKSEVDMFCHEVRILSLFNHPNVAKLIGACVDNPSKFAILTEFVPGGSLHTILHVQKRTLDLTSRLIVIKSLACALEYLHTMTPRPIMFHRDLNSNNVLLLENGQAVLIDFGESRFAAGDDPGARVSETFTLQAGSLRFMAPEIFVQNSIYTEKADIFSFALVVWELGSGGRVPFEELKPAAAAAAMAYHNQRPPIPITCPKPIEQLMQQAWHTDAVKRPSATDIIAWLTSHYAHGQCNSLDSEGFDGILAQKFDRQNSAPTSKSDYVEDSETLEKFTQNGYVADVMTLAYCNSSGAGASARAQPPPT